MFQPVTDFVKSSVYVDQRRRDGIMLIVWLDCIPLLLKCWTVQRCVWPHPSLCLTFHQSNIASVLPLTAQHGLHQVPYYDFLREGIIFESLSYLMEDFPPGFLKMNLCHSSDSPHCPVSGEQWGGAGDRGREERTAQMVPCRHWDWVRGAAGTWTSMMMTMMISRAPPARNTNIPPPPGRWGRGSRAKCAGLTRRGFVSVGGSAARPAPLTSGGFCAGHARYHSSWTGRGLILPKTSDWRQTTLEIQRKENCCNQIVLLWKHKLTRGHHMSWALQSIN